VGDSPSFWFFQYTFSATSVTIVAGTLAERCQMAAYLCYSVVLAGFVYPVVAHSIWSNNGFLSITNVKPLLEIGAVDFAGSGVVHITGKFLTTLSCCGVKVNSPVELTSPFILYFFPTFQEEPLPCWPL
jgi:Amt family ammonium transporter